MKILFEDLLPGETPIDDISELKIQGISLRRELAVHEAENIRQVLAYYFTDRPREIASFDFDWAKQLHGDMYGEVWGWAGRFRAHKLSLGCAWTQIQERLYNLLEDLRIWEREGVELVEQSALLHHRAVQIHPFYNGNGRWARMLANIWLVDHGCAFVAWPEKMIGDRSAVRDEYIAALEAADLGEMQQIIELHRRFTPMPARPVVSQPLRSQWSATQYRIVQQSTRAPSQPETDSCQPGFQQESQVDNDDAPRQTGLPKTQPLDTEP